MAKASPTTISPPILAPASNFQSGLPVVPTTHGVPPPSTSLTSREWIVPPRPKPGRKPATDAPPTKRKAQNRAAQRAFRERRAARVGELEEEIKKIEVEDEEEQNALRAKIEKLQREVEKYRTSLTFWMQTCRGLEAELATENAAKEEALRLSKDTPTASALSASSSNDQSQNEALNEGAEAMGCGNCSSISNCQCIQEVINMQGLGSDADNADPSSSKRPHSPDYNDSISKRIKPEPSDDLETDFTSSFSKRPSNTTREDSTSPSSPSAIVDPCGFCTDATPCICADMQAETDASNISDNTHNHRSHNPDRAHTPCHTLELEPVPQQNGSSLLPRISQLAHITPPPSDTDVFLSTSSSQLHASALPNPCTNGPGTCLQCRSDPNSTLFCKSLAKSRVQGEINASIPTHQQQNGCCGANAGTANSCCQSDSQPQSITSKAGTGSAPGTRTRSSGQNISSTLCSPSIGNNSSSGGRGQDEHETIQPITLTCADVYTTLSRHPGYAKATGDMARWLPRLHPIPAPHTPLDRKNSDDTTAGKERGVEARVVANGMEGRPALEIDAANVMAVLRDFDWRFT